MHAFDREDLGKPCAGNLHARFEEGGGGGLYPSLRYSTVLLLFVSVPADAHQLISMSCPRAGPVGNLFRSMLKNGSTFMPSGPTWTNRTKNRPEWSSVLRERVRDIHPLAVAGHVHHVRLNARRDRALELGMLGVGDVPLLDQVVAKAAHVEVFVVGALAQVGRQVRRCRRPS